MGRFQVAGFGGAGVFVDFGSFVPIGSAYGVKVTIREVRVPTGVGRREAIRALWQTPQWASNS